jgi:HK97 family phage major capsid protein
MSKLYTDAERKAKEEKRNDLITRAESIVAEAKKENRELTVDEMEEIAEIRDDVEKIKKALGLDDDFREMPEAEAKPDEEPKEDENRACGEEEKRAMNELQERAMFEEYVRGIVNERDTNLTKGDNGAVIPATIANKIIKKVYDISPVLDRSNKYNVKGTLTIPYYDEASPNDAITVAYATEFSDLASHVGEFTSTVTLTGFLAGALVKISRSLINNSQFNIVDHVIDLMAESIARFIDKELLNPSDPSHKVKGLSALTNRITASSASAITADEIVKLHDAIKDRYQSNAIWVMSPATRTALRLLKDEMGRYLSQDDVSLPFGTSLLGKPVYVSDAMPEIATGNNVIYYGDFKGLATKFSENINIQILRERFATQHADACIAWFEMDATVEDNQRLAVLTMA